MFLPLAFALTTGFAARQYHVIAFEGLLQADTAEYVHHLVLAGFYGAPDCGKACSEWLDEMFASEDGSSSSSSSTFEEGQQRALYSSPSGSSYPSDDSSTVSFTEYFENLNITLPSFCSNYGEEADIFLWAPGLSNLELPDDVGFLFGNESGGFNSLNIQTHYNNPDGVSGETDSSGVRVYYTEELRPMQMGVMKLGDPSVALADQPLPDGKSSFSFGCPGTCSETNFEVSMRKQSSCCCLSLLLLLLCWLDRKKIVLVPCQYLVLSVLVQLTQTPSICHRVRGLFRCVREVRRARFWSVLYGISWYVIGRRY